RRCRQNGLSLRQSPGSSTYACGGAILADDRELRRKSTEWTWDLWGRWLDPSTKATLARIEKHPKRGAAIRGQAIADLNEAAEADAASPRRRPGRRRRTTN